MDNRQKGYYVNITYDILTDEDLLEKPKSILLYGHISTLMQSEGFCFASNSYFADVLKISHRQIGRMLTLLEEKGYIKREFVYKNGEKVVDLRKIYVRDSIKKSDNNKPSKPKTTKTAKPAKVKSSPQPIAKKKAEDIYATVFFKMIKNYPVNKIGNRIHALKHFRDLSLPEVKLAVNNMKRYIATVDNPTYYKKLTNYITEHCWSEAWLTAAEKATPNNNVATSKIVKLQEQNKFSGTY